jgi:HEAT repeat protein
VSTHDGGLVGHPRRIGPAASQPPPRFDAVVVDVLREGVMVRRSPRSVLVVLAALAVVPSVRAQDDTEPSAPAAAEGVGRLVDALQSGETFKVRATAAVALGRLGDTRALAPLSEALRRDESFAVRAAAAAAIGRLGDAAGLPALFAALGDSEQYVRGEAEEALARFHTLTHLFAFREALRGEDALARRAAVTAYGEVMREPGASPALAALVVNALGDDDEDVIAAATRAVSGLPHDRVVPLLLDGLAHGGSGVRAGCARLLEKHTDARAVEPLIALAVDTDQPEDVRRAVGSALRQHQQYVDVGGAAARAGNAADPDRLRSLRLLAVVGDARADALIESALADSDAAVRITAARAAADSGQPKARAALLAAADREPDARIKRQLELILKTMR